MVSSLEIQLQGKGLRGKVNEFTVNCLIKLEAKSARSSLLPQKAGPSHPLSVVLPWGVGGDP